MSDAETLRSILRKIAADADVELCAYGKGRPDRAGQRYLGFDYSTVDLTPEEADLFAAIDEELSR